MSDTIKLKNHTGMRHQANLGEEVATVEFEAGTELQVLQSWRDAWLVKDDEGRLFNVKKELAEEA